MAFAREISDYRSYLCIRSPLLRSFGEQVWPVEPGGNSPMLSGLIYHSESTGRLQVFGAHISTSYALAVAAQ